MEILIDSNKIPKKLIIQNSKKFYYVYERSDKFDLTKDLNLINLSNKNDLVKFTKKQDGFFRFVIWNKDFIFSAVDQIASKSILYKIDKKKLSIYIDPPLQKKIDQDALVDIYYSGYTTHNETIYKNIKTLLPGEYIFLDNKKRQYEKSKWNNFSPIYNTKINNNKNFEEVIFSVFSKIKKRNTNKNFLVPLSAGFDSRLIVSAMKKIEMNFDTFTYGFRNQRDFRITKEICKKLDVKNYQIVMNSKNTDIYNSQKFNKFLNFNNYGISANNFGDYGPLFYLDQKINKNEFIIINGQAGDFLTGGHLPVDIISKKNSIEKNKSLLLSYILNKHYSLWTPVKNDFKKRYINHVNEIYFKKSKNYIDLLKAYERYEFENRQSKWVTGQQKVYDFFGYAWELPLWKTSVMNFFGNNLSLNEKINQSFYKKFLMKKNYYRIWKEIDLNSVLTFPFGLNVIRFVCKLIFFIIGKKKWYRFEKKYLEYFYDPTGVSKMIKYKIFLSLDLIPRNSISIITKKYFDRHKKR